LRLRRKILLVVRGADAKPLGREPAVDELRVEPALLAESSRPARVELGVVGWSRDAFMKKLVDNDGVRPARSYLRVDPQ